MKRWLKGDEQHSITGYLASSLIYFIELTLLHFFTCPYCTHFHSLLFAPLLRCQIINLNLAMSLITHIYPTCLRSGARPLWGCLFTYVSGCRLNCPQISSSSSACVSCGCSDRFRASLTSLYSAALSEPSVSLCQRPAGTHTHTQTHRDLMADGDVYCAPASAEYYLRQVKFNSGRSPVPCSCSTFYHSWEWKCLKLEGVSLFSEGNTLWHV